MSKPEEIKKKIEEMEAAMSAADFWVDKDRAQRTLREHEALKDELAGVGKYDKGGAVMKVRRRTGGRGR